MKKSQSGILRMMERGVLAAVLLAAAPAATAWAYMLNGAIRNNGGMGISSANVILQNTEVDSLTYSAITDAAGAYAFENIEEGNYLFSISAPGYKAARFTTTIDKDITGLALPLADDPEAKSTDLDEVEVVAEALKSYADHDDMFLTKFNRSYGLNALDAISSLPKFIPAINSDDLKDINGNQVNILIDGRRASYDQLKNLDSNAIAKVSYYQDAPAKYAGLYGGAVVNVILRKPKELKIGANIDANTSVVAPYTSDKIGFTMRTPSSFLNATYNFSYLNLKDVTSVDEYRYPDLVNSFTSDKDPVRNHRHTADISYQWDTGGHLLYADFNYKGSHTNRGTLHELLTEKSADGSINGTRLTDSHKTSDSFALDLYYSYKFANGMEIMADLVGSINSSTNDIDQAQSTAAGSAYDDFSYLTSIYGKLHSVIADVAFSTPLWGGSASASLYHSYRHLDQTYLNDLFASEASINISEMNTTGATIDYSRQFGRLGMMARMGVWNDYQKDADGKTHNSPYFLPRISLNYRLSNLVNLRMMAWGQASTPALAAQNVNRYFIDTRYYRENIPYMSTTQKYCVDLSADITLPNANLMLMPLLAYSWTHHPYVAHVYREGDIFIQRPTQIPCINTLQYNLTAIWMPHPTLQLRPMLKGEYNAYATPLQRHRFNYVQGMLFIQYLPGPVQISASVTTPKKTVSGETESYNGWAFELGAYWNITSSFYAGASISCTPSASWQSLSVPGFTNYISSKERYNAYWTCISIGYSLSTGRLNRSAQRQKMLMNSESQSGI